MVERFTLASDPDVSVAVGCGVLCMVYRGAHHASFPEQTVEWGNRAVELLEVEAVPVINIIEEHAEAPDTQARRGYADGLSRMAARMECMAQVILATGLKGGAYRAISSTIYLFARHPAEIKVFGGLEDAADWISTRSAVCTASPASLLAFIDSVRNG